MSAYNPLTAPQFIAGTVSISGGQIGVPQSLLALIQAQLEANCSGAAMLVTITADFNNAGSVFLGAPSTLGGALSATNFGSELQQGGSHFNSTPGAGNAAPIGPIQVFAAAAAKLHVEVWS